MTKNGLFCTLFENCLKNFCLQVAFLLFCVFRSLLFLCCSSFLGVLKNNKKIDGQLPNTPYFAYLDSLTVYFSCENVKISQIKLVEATGLEPTTFWSLTKRATKLRYASICNAYELSRPTA